MNKIKGKKRPKPSRFKREYLIDYPNYRGKDHYILWLEVRLFKATVLK